MGEGVNTPPSPSRNAAGRRFQRAWLLAALAVAIGLASASCYTGTGSYPIEVFSEMHYSQSFKAAEPPRLLPPEGSVPRNFREARADGAGLYSINCSMCHGIQGKGDGTVLDALTIKYKYTPLLDADLTGETVTNLSDEAMADIIRQGVNVMPSFSNLLTEEEIGLIVRYVRALR